MFDIYDYMPYGVVQAANEFIVMNNWKVCGFALHREMYAILRFADKDVRILPIYNRN